MICIPRFMEIDSCIQKLGMEGINMQSDSRVYFQIIKIWKVHKNDKMLVKVTANEHSMEFGLQVWRKMLEKKVVPDLFTYNLLLRSVRDCGLGDVHVALDVFNRITGENKISKVNSYLYFSVIFSSSYDICTFVCVILLSLVS